MDPISIPAHFDGQQILLDEPFDLEPNSKLIVTVVGDNHDAERAAWMRLSADGLSRAYDDNEEEYSLDLIKTPNSEYEGR